MCPPIDPILPLGGVTGDLYVERAELPGRVRRRTRHEDESEEQRRRREHHEPDPGDTWTGTEEADAGTYDDHGRAHRHRDDDELPPHRHVDAKA